MVCALSGHDNTVCSVFSRPTVSKQFLVHMTQLVGASARKPHHAKHSLTPMFE
ncbi:hypothetical protein MA16_Dca027636 [Dendrobium catenatum]|uniref:Uncharacterized protein n=1 Tax=Dendrobium catenatum TaxID=906689 RepID=A0A2I0WJG4_9ASPA|nr:hypothetical protein MA16_Dca027636 [Dendrobium catenatum]